MSAENDPYDSRLLPRDFLSRQSATPRPPVTARSAAPPRPAEPRPAPTPTAAPKAAAPAEKAQPSAVELCKRIELSAEAKELLQEGLTPWAFVERLTEKRLHADALRVTAHALAKREAVWWACQCVKSVLGASPAAPITAALRISESWSADPSEGNRRAAQPAAEAAGLTHPARRFLALGSEVAKGLNRWK